VGGGEVGRSIPAPGYASSGNYGAVAERKEEAVINFKTLLLFQ
jgi:hypothetical protein